MGLSQVNVSHCVFQELFGAVQVTPLSSGYALGSSNWIIQSHYEKVSYVSGSSLLTTHPQVQPLTFLRVSLGGTVSAQKRGYSSWDQVQDRGHTKVTVLSVPGLNSH